jgi:ABC-2 type transport system permease protein
MRNVLTLARKELTLFFTTPWAYLVFAAMAAISAFFFVALLVTFKEAHELARVHTWAKLPPDFAPYRNLTDGVIVQLWGSVMVITLMVTPLLSMGLFTRERRDNTFELLMTTPVRPIEIVLGKYLSGVVMISATIGITVVFPVVLSIFGSSESGKALEWSTVLLGYSGLLLWGATCIAIGMFISALTDSQLLAAFVTFVVLLGWMLLRSLTRAAEEPLRSIAEYLAFDAQAEPLLKGVFDPRSLVFFLSVILLANLFTHRAVEAQRWT